MNTDSTLLRNNKKHTFSANIRLILMITIGLFCILLCSVFILYHIGRCQFEKRLSSQISHTLSDSDRFYFQEIPAIPSPFSVTPPTELEYHDKTYHKNPNLIVIYFMGIDLDSPVSETNVSEGGQSDANFLIFIDIKEKTIKIASVNRNAMTSVDIYDTFNEYGYTIPAQLCLQHAYGNGMQESCERSCNALSRLLYHMPINGYYALQKGAVAALNDSIGGVQVTALEDVIFPYPETLIHKGDKILLKGNNAYYYLTFRYIENFGSNNGRLERERQYVNAFLHKFYTTTIRNPFQLIKCYQSLHNYSVSDLSAPELLYMFCLAKQYTIDTNIYNLPGKTVLEGTYESYYISEDDIISFILNYYYLPK